MKSFLATIFIFLTAFGCGVRESANQEMSEPGSADSTANWIKDDVFNQRITSQFSHHLDFIDQPIELPFDSTWDSDRRFSEGWVRLTYIYGWSQPETYLFGRSGSELLLIRTELDTTWDSNVFIQFPHTDTLKITESDYRQLIIKTVESDIWYFEEFAIEPYVMDDNYLLMEVSLGLGRDRLYLSSPESNLSFVKLKESMDMVMSDR